MRNLSSFGSLLCFSFLMACGGGEGSYMIHRPTVETLGV